MRAPSIASIAYTPEQVPADIRDLPRFVQQELGRISSVISLLAAGHLDVSYAEPAKPREGDIRLADGTNWNPTGGGMGVYAYYASAWHRLG